jgi:hypothetical protein
MKIVLTESQLKRLFKEDKNTNIKEGEKWFYKPENYCLRNHKPPLELSGGSAKYIFNDGVSYIAYEDGGRFYYSPKPENPRAFRYNHAFLDKEGNWWCNNNTGQIDRKVDLEATKRKISSFNSNQISTSNTGNKIPKANTMDDVKNNRGYIIKGMRGPIVKELQKMLIDLGYDLGPQKDDGIFGESTENAVEKFQKDSGVKPKNGVYGIFGKITYDKMMKKSN